MELDPLFIKRVDAIENEHVNVDIQIQGRAKSLYQGDRTGIDYVANLLDMSISTSFQKAQATPDRPAGKGLQETQVERFQIQIDPVTREGGNEAARIRRHQRLLPMFAAAMA